MTVTWQASTGVSTTGAAKGTTSTTVAYVGVAAGRRAFITVGAKPSTGTITTPSGWTKVGEATGGTGTAGNDTGPTKVAVYYKDLDGTETGSVTVTGTSTTSIQACMDTASKSLGSWDTDTFVSASDATHAANLSATAGTWALGGVNVGDQVLVAHSGDTDDSTTATSAVTLTQTGITFGTVTDRSQVRNTSGNQGMSYTWSANVTAVATPGTSNVNAPTAGFTWSVSSCGPLMFVRVRDYDSFSALTDTFTGTTIDTAKWAATNVTQNGLLTFDLTTWPSQLKSVRNYRLASGSAVVINTTSFPTMDGVCYAGVRISPWGEDGNFIGIFMHGDSTLTMERSGTGNTTIALSQTNHKWLRILYNGTDILLQTSPTTSTWTTQLTIAAVDIPAWATWTMLQVIVEGGDGTSSWGVDDFNNAPNLTAITSSTDLRWKSYVGITSSTDLRWKSYVGITSSTDLRWKSYVGITSSTDLRWKSYLGITSSTDLRWKSYLQITQTSDLRWKSYLGITGGVDLRWKSAGQVTSTVDLRWRVAAIVSQTTDLRWKSYVGITSSTDLRWRSYVGITSSIDLRWKSAAQVTSNLDVRWKSYVQITPQTVDLRWKSYVGLTSSVDLRWKSSVIIQTSTDLQWRSYVGLSTSISLTWKSYTAVSQSVDLRWTSRAQVTSDIDLRWKTSSTLLQASQTVDLRWTSRGQVTSTVDLRWNSFTTMSTTVSLPWKSYVKITPEDRYLIWRSYALISGSTDLRWLSRVGLSQTLDLRWRSAGQVSSDLDLRWRVATVVTATMQILWKSNFRMSQTVDLRWKSSATVSTTLDIRWIASAKVRQSILLTWRSLALSPVLPDNGFVVDRSPRVPTVDIDVKDTFVAKRTNKTFVVNRT